MFESGYMLEYICLDCVNEDHWNSFAKAAGAMSSATHHAEGKAAETSTKNGKRQRPDEEEERMYRLNDSELLECPVCFESLQSPPIYQCGNGHVVCSTCREKLPQSKKCPTCSQPTGKLRCIFLEKILASVQVSCKYARHGCEYKRSQVSDILRHEEHCPYVPFPCLFGECVFKGSWITTPEHLAKVHQVPTVKYDNISGAGFTMKPSDRIVMVKSEGNRDWRADLIFVHREPLHETFHGDVFFCTSETKFGSNLVKLKVAYQDAFDIFHSARFNTISVRSAGEYVKDDFLLLPLGRGPSVVNGVKRNERLIEVHLKVAFTMHYILSDD